MQFVMKVFLLTFVTNVLMIEGAAAAKKTKVAQLCLRCKHRKASQKFRACQLMKLSRDLGKVKKNLDSLAKTLDDNYDYAHGYHATNKTGLTDQPTMITSAEGVMSFSYSTASSIYINLTVLQVWGCVKPKERLCKQIKSATKRLRAIICTTSAILNTGVFHGVQGSNPNKKICWEYDGLCNSLLRSSQDNRKGGSDLVNFAFYSINHSLSLTKHVISNIKNWIDKAS